MALELAAQLHSYFKLKPKVQPHSCLALGVVSVQRSSKLVPSYLVGERTPFILLRELGQVSVQC